MAVTKINSNQAIDTFYTTTNNPIIGEGAPTVNTEAVGVGQRYLNSITNEEYICTSLTGGDPTVRYTIEGTGVSVSDDFIASGFGNWSYNNYLSTNFTFSTSLPWEVKAKVVITDGSKTSWCTIIGGENDYKFGVFLGLTDGYVDPSSYTPRKHFQLECSYTGNDWNVNLKSTDDLISNVPYYLKAGWTGSLYYLDISTDGEEYTRAAYVESSTKTVASQPIYIGKCVFNPSSGFPGTIDLKETKFYENNELVFEPVTLGNGPAWKKSQPVAGENITITNSKNSQTISAPGMLKNTATGTDSFTIGGNATSSNYATNLGIKTTAGANYTVAIGTNSSASLHHGIAIGGAEASTDAASTTGEYSVAIGNNAKAVGHRSISIGGSSYTQYDDATAVGHGASAKSYGSVALGRAAVAEGSGTIQIGAGTNTTTGTVKIKNKLLLDANNKLVTNNFDQTVYMASNLTGANGITISAVDIPTIDTNTVHLWHFNGNVYDEIVGENSYYFGTVNFSDGGKFGKCLSSLSNYLNFTGLAGTSSYTADCWLYYVSGNAVTFQLGYQYPTLWLDEDSFAINSNYSGTGSSTGDILYPTGYTFDKNVWHHLAYVNDVENHKVYLFLDGHKVYDVTATSTVAEIYNIKSVSGYYMDELRLSNVARWTADFTPYNQPYGGDPQYVISYSGGSGSLTRKNFTGVTGTNLYTGLTLSNYSTILVYKNGMLLMEDEGESDESDYSINDYHIYENDIIFNTSLETVDKISIVAM